MIKTTIADIIVDDKYILMIIKSAD